MKRFIASVLAALVAASALILVSNAFPTDAAFAQGAPSDDVTAKREAEGRNAAEAAFKAAIPGPSSIKLIDQGTLKLPAGYIFIPKPEAARLMTAMGNRTGSEFIGLVLSGGDTSWFMTLDYINAGYVKDDDAKTWKADELLTTLKEGTESGNSYRAQNGFPPIEVTGWVEVPRYASDTHRLVWAANVRRKSETTGGSVNFNTYALGREGYFSLNLIGSADVVTREKRRAEEILASLTYNPGKDYADFVPGTDRVAEYGLAALVGGVAAKKLGLFALAAAFLLKAWKLVALVAVGLFALVGKLFSRKTT